MFADEKRANAQNIWVVDRSVRENERENVHTHFFSMGMLPPTGQFHFFYFPKILCTEQGAC